MTGASLAVIGDYLAQKREKKGYDKIRAASFACFDACYRVFQSISIPLVGKYGQGKVIHALFSVVGMGANSLRFSTALERTLLYQFGIIPFVYYPVFFSLTGFMQGLSVSGTISRAKENFLPLMKRNLLFWIPVQFVQFGYIQEDLQIPFLSMCGLAWTFILSVAAGSAKSYTPEKEMEKEIIVAAVETEKDTTSKVPSPASTIIAQRS